MATVRNSIVEAVATRMQTITVANGYSSDIGLKYRAWQTTKPAWSELPIIEVRDPTSALGQPFYAGRQHDLTVQVVVLLQGGTSMEALREYAADILVAAGKDPTWIVDETALATGTVPGEIPMDPGDAAAKVAAAVIVELIVSYETEMWVM